MDAFSKISRAVPIRTAFDSRSLNDIVCIQSTTCIKNGASFIEEKTVTVREASELRPLPSSDDYNLTALIKAGAPLQDVRSKFMLINALSDDEAKVAFEDFKLKNNITD